MSGIRSFIFFTVVLLISSACAKAQSLTEKESQLLGQWRLSHLLSNDVMIECPDVIKLRPDMRYEVLNDCYGEGSQNPLVESGRWTIDVARNVLRLSERNFVTNYELFDRSQEVELHFRLVNSDELHVEKGGSGDDDIEVYHRID